MGTAVLLAVSGFSASASGAPLAPVDGAAANGGAVIVVLNNQHSTGQFAALNASREGVVHAEQGSVLAAVRAQGGTDVRQLVSVNAIAAHLSVGAVAALRANPSVASIQPDVRVPFLGAPVPSAGPATKVSQEICPADPAKPLLEPEALSVTHTDQAAKIATGKGVIVSIDGMNDLAGNPNLIRPDGSHVVLDSPTPNADNGNDESFGDASVVAAQGVVTYDYSRELPFSGLPAGCTFRIKGLAPDASLVDPSNTDTPDTQAQGELESQIIAGIDNAVVKLHANVISQSFGFYQPGGVNLLFQADDAAVAAGVTVAASSGDSGSSGTVILPASDPNVIAVGATDTLRLRAQADGYGDWVSDNLAALSSGGPAANDKVVDLVAPGDSSAVSCNPAAAQSGCPTNTQTETFRGTSMSAPIVAGAAADVIQAYADSHGGAKPAPAVVKQLLAGTATDLGAPADQQGSGLLDVYAAVRAAQQEPGGSTAASDTPGLIPSVSQVDIAGNGGSTTTARVSLYNASDKPTTVTGRFRELSQPSQIGKTVTEQITAPAPGAPIPAQGSPAAAPITFTVPGGLAQFNADMIIPDPKNSTDVGVTLFDPKGRLAQISYSYNADFAGAGPAPNASTWRSRHRSRRHLDREVLLERGRCAAGGPARQAGQLPGQHVLPRHRPDRRVRREHRAGHHRRARRRDRAAVRGLPDRARRPPGIRAVHRKHGRAPVRAGLPAHADPGRGRRVHHDDHRHRRPRPRPAEHLRRGLPAGKHTLTSRSRPRTPARTTPTPITWSTRVGRSPRGRPTTRPARPRTCTSRPRRWAGGRWTCSST